MARVLLLTPSAAPGGAERVLVSIASRLREHGWEPVAVALEDGRVVDDLRDAGCPTTVLAIERTRNPLRSSSVLLTLTRMLRTDIDLILSNQSKGHVLGGGAALLARRPSVFWQHVIPDREPVARVASRIPATATMCTSDAAVAAQRRLAPRAQIHKVNPGIELERVIAQRGQGGAIRERLGWTDHPIVGIIGRLQEWKGQREFLDAAAVIAGRDPQARFVLVGGAVLSYQDDTYERELRQQTSSLGLENVVHFAGHQRDVYPWFDALDVVVHASYGEPFGLVLLEAMAMGKPLVATAAGGPLEIVEDGTSGLLVPMRDAGALAHAVSRVLEDPALSARLSSAAAQRAQHFSAERMTEGVVAVLDEAYASRRRPQRRLR